MSPMQGPVPDSFARNYGFVYDSFALTAVAIGAKKVFFETPKGATKGLEFTNLDGKGFELSNPESEFDIYAMRAVLIGFTPTDMEGVMKNYALQLYIGNVVQLEGPIHCFNAGAGIAGGAATTVAATSLQAWSNGVPDSRAAFQMPQGSQIKIGQGDSFRVEMIGTSYTMIGTGFLQLVLEGMIYNAIRGGIRG